MAVGEAPLPPFFPIEGISIGTAAAGIRKVGRQDLTVFAIAEGAVAAGVFTRNAFCAAPVHLCRKHLAQAAPRYLLVNTGNANAGTGEQGMQDALACVAALARKTGVADVAVLPFSTGVIGEPLPVDRVVAGLDAALASLQSDHWSEAATAIMTTDTRPKGVTASIEVGSGVIHISGIAKGAGMIKPNMATMLSFVATDASISQNLLQAILDEAIRLSFNRITVDGDTSTNDSAILVATGKSVVDVDLLPAVEQELVRKAITDLFIELAQLIVRDGEGATKFVSVEVCEGKTEQECERVAYAVAESPLVKTALFASDPNWGRILAAAGRAGVESFDVSQVTIHLNGVLIAERGGRASSYTEAAGAEALGSEEIVIRIGLGRGDAAATVWTTDLSHDYVTINAEYRS
jgi:glutamate N-acetyltransferase/amino-acid N-acetyltransferase